MARGDKADLFFRKLRSAGLSKPAVQTLAERLDALEAADSAASGVSELIASGLASTGHLSGEDIYPPLTVAALSGSDITLDVDGQTIHCAAGIYDVSVAYRLSSAMECDTWVFVDGLPTVHTILFREVLPAGQHFGHPAALGVILPVAADLALNFEMDEVAPGVGNTWDITMSQITVRRIGDVPNP